MFHLHSVGSVYPHQNLEFPEGTVSSSKVNKVTSSCVQASQVSLLSIKRSWLYSSIAAMHGQGGFEHTCFLPCLSFSSGHAQLDPPCSSEALTTRVFIAPMALYIISTINIIKLSGETQSRKRGTTLNSNDADHPWLHGDRILTSLDLSVGIRLTNHMGRSSSHTVEYWWTSPPCTTGKWVSIGNLYQSVFLPFSALKGLPWMI